MPPIAESGLVTLEIENVTYTLLRRLGWKAQQRIDDSAVKLFIDGKTISSMKSIDDLAEVEMRVDNAKMNTERLYARLQGLTRQQIDEIPGEHVPLLIEAIEELEAEQRAATEALRPKPVTSPETTS